MSDEKKDQSAIEMFVGGLVLDPNTQAPVVVLKDESGDLHLPIWIGVAEATSIASAIKELEMARPLTHDLMADIFEETGVRVERVVITDLEDGTYFAELVLSQGEKALIMDSRPSDAIAIALRCSAPVYVMREVLEKAKVSLHEPSSEKSSKSSQEGSSEAPSSEEELPVEEDVQDFKNIDKDKWAEILEDLDADDFKYKM